MNNKNILSNKINFKTLIGLDWDNSLYPTSWTNKNMINLNNPDSVKEYKLYFTELDKTISNFLKELLNYGEIYIVTNASMKWIKACLNVLPITKKLIMEYYIRIVSARDNYSQLTSSPTEWKINTFRDITHKIVQDLPEDYKCKTFLNIISLGDAHYEYIALLKLDDYFKNTDKKVNYLLKSIKFIEDDPHFDQIIDQLLVVQKNARAIIGKIGYLDLKFIE
jgi:hypothetical protein